MHATSNNLVVQGNISAMFHNVLFFAVVKVTLAVNYLQATSFTGEQYERKLRVNQYTRVMEECLLQYVAQVIYIIRVGSAVTSKTK
jgi:hypothetical protein